MFMVKEEYENIKQLFYVKVKIARKSFVGVCLTFTGLFVYTLILILTNTQQGAGLSQIGDFSDLLLINSGLLSLMMMIMYRSDNHSLSVLPQTNNSRFISRLLLHYLYVVCLALLALFLYLMSYGILKVISILQSNIYLVLTFDFGFLVVGFFTFLMYSFLIAAAFELLGAAFRKWKYYTGLVCLALFIFSFYQTNGMYVVQILSFLTLESVFGWFMLKGIVLWMLITGVSIAINRYTIYYKVNHSPVSVRMIATFSMILLAILVLLSIQTESGMPLAPEPESATLAVIGEGIPVDSYQEIRIDVSHLPNGSKVNVIGDNIWWDQDMSGTRSARGANWHPRYVLLLENVQELEHLQGETIVLRYRFPEEIRNGFDTMRYFNPQLIAYLDGNTLHIQYNYEKVYMISLPIWSVARQFEVYQNKGVLAPDLISQYYSYRDGSIKIDVQ